MPVTKNYGFPLYDPEDSPDLTTTGREAGAIIAIDDALKTEETERIEGDAGLNAALEKETAERKAADKELTDNLAKEVTDRKAADTALGGRIDTEAAARESADTALGVRIDAEAAAREAADTALGKRIDTEKADREAITGDIVKQLAKEKADREAADTALGSRIDNAETEISANSADLTGIKGLTYRDTNVFVENDNGEYDSPALIEIAHEIDNAKITVVDMSKPLTIEDFNKVPNLIGYDPKTANYFSVTAYVTSEQVIYFQHMAPGLYLLEASMTVGAKANIATKYMLWNNVNNKPFSTIGSGLKVVDNALTLDAAAPSGGTNVTVSTGQTGLTVTPVTDGDTTRYDINLKAATKMARGGVAVGSGLNVNAAGLVSVDTAALPTLSPSAGILIDTSTSGGRKLYTVQASVDDKTIGFNDNNELTVLSTGGTGGITGDTTWSELES